MAPPDLTDEAEGDDRVTPWHEDDDFWQTVAPVLFGQARLDAAPAEVEQVVALLGIEPGAAVLDLGCGVGRHSIELARRGFRVTAVDRTASYLERAREAVGAEGLSIEFIQDDMRRFRRDGEFDAAINLYTTFGYFEDPGDDRRVAENVSKSLKAGGGLVMELMGREIIERIFRPRDWHRLDDGSIVLEEREVSDDWSWIENTWTLLPNEGPRRELHLSHRLYSAKELKDLLLASGFSRAQAYGGLDGSPYDSTARRLAVRAVR